MLGLGAVLFIVYRSTFDTMALVMATSSTTGQLQALFEQVGRDIQSARGRITATCGLYTPSSSLLILDIPNAGGMGSGLDRVICRQNGANLERILATATSCATPQVRVLASNMTDVYLLPAGTALVDVRLQVRSGPADRFVVTSGKLAVQYRMRNAS